MEGWCGGDGPDSRSGSYRHDNYLFFVTKQCVKTKLILETDILNTDGFKRFVDLKHSEFRELNLSKGVIVTEEFVIAYRSMHKMLFKEL